MAVHRPERHGRRAREDGKQGYRTLGARSAIELTIDIEDTRALSGDVINVPGIQTRLDQRMPVQPPPQSRDGGQYEQWPGKERQTARPTLSQVSVAPIEPERPRLGPNPVQ